MPLTTGISGMADLWGIREWFGKEPKYEDSVAYEEHHEQEDADEKPSRTHDFLDHKCWG